MEEESQMDTLSIHAYNDIPSSQDFSSLIEDKNIPAVFLGLVREWEAFTKWNPSNGGLDYLQDKVGSSVVEAMLSRSGSVFYGDIGSHERIPLQFSSFISSCKLRFEKSRNLQVAQMIPNNAFTSEPVDSVGNCESDGETSYQAYLAQVPILNAEDPDKSPLAPLQGDIQVPLLLERKSISSINFWMNKAQSRSSTHYDPHHNLLCVVTGCKQVVLWPPSATPSLKLMAVYGEASNHSAVDINKFGASTDIMGLSKKVILHAGDALFIPEGWFHQVDSDDLTIAVNIWWQSDMISRLLEHMDAYYLRRIVKRLVDKETKQMLNPSSAGNKNFGVNISMQPNVGVKEVNNELATTCSRGYMNVNQLGIEQFQLDPIELQSLRELVSFVHDNFGASGQSQMHSNIGEQGLAGDLNGEVAPRLVTEVDSFSLEDDVVAKILWNLEPVKLQNVLLAMVSKFPRSLETLILHMLSPAAAEVLTQKFDEMDIQVKKVDQKEFYRQFYGIFDDQYAAMDAILKGKESFGFLALGNVLDHYLGVCCECPKELIDKAEMRPSS
ncbi:uncharacterized protein LOC18429593 isoform X1 [Amborella trichopoda]|uniref:uncharacterized protein LOC18429593 isoform X1 n=1 Tax=Amborella trichopoda TaxID=13333 RepID=UPI0009BD22F4|nr:uncharacterized protein LOC18429593 isoform X1 [Amborella trichopoda]|eukprot:XP_020520100.1 uncharacterized protein LOC18429593 isoform X1 [Amborella trichopoda]